MIEKVISGGQDGADQGGLRAARASGLETGGFAPLGWETEDGPAPWLADWGLVECETPGYPARTEANVKACDCLLLFGDRTSAGGKLTSKLTVRNGKPTVFVSDATTHVSHVVEFLANLRYARALMVGGNRESKAPGIGERVERFLILVFRQLAREAGDGRH